MSKRHSLVQRSSRRKGKSTIGNFIPFVIGGLVLVAIFGYVAIQPTPTDPRTFCPQDTTNMGITALVIDVSDKLTNSQAAKLENELINISNISAERPTPFLKKGEKLLVYFVEPEGQVPSMVFSMCHPGDIANRTLTDELSEGAIYAQKKWNKFTNDIMTTIDTKISGSNEIATSPIIETVQFIRAKSFPPPDLMNAATNYRLIIWSDLLQNSAEGDHFKALGDYKLFLKRNPIELSGIELSVFQLISKKYVEHQTKEHVVWWRRVFATSKVDLNIWEKL